MDSRDHLRALPDGLACTVCHEPVPVDRIRMLAHRGDLTFIQVECGSCGSTALEFLADLPGPGSGQVKAPAITSDDVFAAHEFLADWHGDVRTLFSAAGGTPPPDAGRRA